MAASSSLSLLRWRLFIPVCNQAYEPAAMPTPDGTSLSLVEHEQ
jgi:hypothetical protein